MSNYAKINEKTISIITQHIIETDKISKSFKIFEKLYEDNMDLKDEWFNYIQILINNLETKNKKFFEYCFNHGLFDDSEN